MTADQKVQWAAKETLLDGFRKDEKQESVLKTETRSFDPRSEVSEDARYIAKKITGTLWIIFVLLPVVSVILFEILTAK
jgi:hypothetical protein